MELSIECGFRSQRWQWQYVAIFQYFNIFFILFTNITTIHFWLFHRVGDWLKTIYSHTRGIGKRMIGFRNHLFSCFDKFRSFQIETFAVEKTTSRLVQLLAGCADVLLGGLSWRRRWRGLPDCTTNIIPSGAKSAFPQFLYSRAFQQGSRSGVGLGEQNSIGN